MFTESRISVGGRCLNVATGPQHGPPLVFLHGLGRCWRDFAPLFGALTPQWSIYAFDHRGHGKSDRGDRYYLDDYIGDAISLIKAIRHEPVILIGHSLGAMTSIGVAAQAPESVRGVILIDPPSASFLQRIEETNYATLWRAMQRLAGDTRPVGAIGNELAEIILPSGGKFGQVRDLIALRFMAKCLRDLDAGTVTAALEQRWLTGYDMVASAQHVQAPTLLLAADEAVGGMLPSPDANQLMNAIADGVCIPLKGMGHLPHWQSADAVLKHVHAFLQTLV